MKNNHASNLSTVVESAYSKQHPVNGKMCTICAKKHRIGQPHNHVMQAQQRTDSGVKGAPYYQPMSISKPTNTMNQRSNSNGRTKPYNRQLRQGPPKWMSKEYKPVFKMPENYQSQTIEHRTSGEFNTIDSKKSQLPSNRPDIVVLSHTHASMQQSLSPRSDKLSSTTAPFLKQ